MSSVTKLELRRLCIAKPELGNESGSTLKRAPCLGNHLKRGEAGASKILALPSWSLATRVV
jgi:hypothetical protein